MNYFFSYNHSTYALDSTFPSFDRVVVFFSLLSISFYKPHFPILKKKNNAANSHFPLVHLILIATLYLGLLEKESMLQSPPLTSLFINPVISLGFPPLCFIQYVWYVHIHREVDMSFSITLSSYFSETRP